MHTAKITPSLQRYLPSTRTGLSISLKHNPTAGISSHKKHSRRYPDSPYLNPFVFIQEGEGNNWIISVLDLKNGVVDCILVYSWRCSYKLPTTQVSTTTHPHPHTCTQTPHHEPNVLQSFCQSNRWLIASSASWI